MAGETVITVVGNLTADPELKFASNGTAFANFTIASTPRTFDRQANEWRDGEALFLRCTVWGNEMAQQVAQSLAKGMRVIASGQLRQRNYQDNEGNKRSSMELRVDEIGPSLRYATAQVSRTPRQGGGGGGGFGAQPAGQSDWGKPAAPQGGDNPWGAPSGPAQGGGFGSGFDDEQPF
ncbi:MAG: single-stranded DNA-binding protein [Microbacteriaceae bacterium]|nr:single-stranded DNA-binding protein [Microbacteriaceae bacterium]